MMNALLGIALLCVCAVASAAPGQEELRGKLAFLEQLSAEKAITAAELKEARQAVLRSFAAPAQQAPAPAPHTQSNSTTPGQGPFTTLVWSDEFDFFNFSNWQHEISMSGGGNWEFEFYSNNRSTSFVRDGKLFLKPRLTEEIMGEAAMLNGGSLSLWGGAKADLCTSNAFYGCERASDGSHIINPVQSARLRTSESLNVKYGRLEVRAKLPRGDWLWPAIWMLPRRQEYGVWPASGEIDIMESRGNAAGYPAGGVDKVGSTLHWGPFFGQDKWPSTHGELQAAPGTDFASDFHTYGVEWTADYLCIYVDSRDNAVLNITFPEGGFWEKGAFSSLPGALNPWLSGSKAAPFDREFYLTLNVAVGGTNAYFPDSQGGKCWENASPTAALDFWKCRSEWQKTWVGDDVAMQIDHVRVWQ